METIEKSLRVVRLNKELDNMRDEIMTIGTPSKMMAICGHPNVNITWDTCGVDTTISVIKSLLCMTDDEYETKINKDNED